MMARIIGWLVSLGFGGLVDKGLGYLERRAELENDREKLKTMTTVELAKAAVAETKIMAEFNAAKLEVPWFWVLLFAVSAPLVIWEWAVVIDGLPYARDLFGDQQVADLPTPALQDAFAAMVKWVFFIGSGVGAFKVATRR